LALQGGCTPAGSEAPQILPALLDDLKFENVCV